MSQDVHNQYTGVLFNKDRQGITTPDAEASERLRPYLPVSYSAPYLPGLRVDDGHPILGQIAISSQMLVGVDKSGALVPAGMRSGNTGSSPGGAHATGAGYFALKYSANDVKWGVLHPLTGAVVTANAVAVIAAPSDAANSDVITFNDGTTYTVQTGDIAPAQSCNLFPGGIVKPLGVAIQNVWQYLGATVVSSTTNGILYTLNGVVPIKWRFHGYMHEMGTAIQTQYYLRLPYIGNDAKDLQAVCTALSMTFTHSDFARSFVHATGTQGASAGQLHVGCLVKASTAIGDAGHYAPWVAGTDGVDLIVGRCMAIEATYPPKDFLNRVKTLWDNSRLGGPLQQPSQAAVMMGGSQTGGIDWALNLSTDAALKAALDQGKTPDPKMYTYVYVMVDLA
jgi:hypothetical protein